MIVKKLAISKGFLEFNSVKILSNSVSFDCGPHPVFYDIETTGLSRHSTFLYLIGALTQENHSWFLYQWMAESHEEEKELLNIFSDFLKSASSTIQYNGTSFDQPYLEERYKIHNLPSPFVSLPSLDLYQKLKSCKDLLKLKKMKQPDLEYFLGLPARKHCSGEECVRLYKSYEKNRDSVLRDIIMGHNEEDMLGLEKIFSMMAYPALMTRGYEPLNAFLENDRLIIKFKLPVPVPVPVSKKGDGFYFTCREKEGALEAEAANNKVKQYYSNYKDYDYIPQEDTAMPKILSRYMDKSLRKNARPETCYTWFLCDESFLDDKDKQKQYLNHTLPCLLSQK